MKSRFAMLATVAALLFVAMATAAEPSKNPSSIALSHAAKSKSLPADRLALDAIAPRHLVHTGVTLWDAKIRDVQTGAVFAIHVDDKFQGRDSIQSFLAAEEDARARALGKKSGQLHELLETLADSERVRLAVWLHDIVPVANRPMTDVSDAAIAMRLAQSSATYARLELKFLEFLRESGFHLVYAAQYAPLVFVDVTKKDVPAIEAHEHVVMVDRTHTGAAEMSSAAPTERAQAAWNRGMTGAGAPRVAVVEADGVEFLNPFLPLGGLHYDSANPRVDSHATAVAGIIQSTHATHRGIAHGTVGVLSANAVTYNDADIIAATEWAVTRGARIISNSWGGDTNLAMGTMDRYLDHLVWNDWVTVIKSAGNNAGGSGTGTSHVTSPGLGYNMITVGAIYDQNDANWANDVMASYSSFKDPLSPHGDREKPEVAAVGSSITSTTKADPWIGAVGSGTSYAAPQVSGQAAVLMQRANWLQVWPEVLKAVVIATANHNIEGASRLSDVDGAGAINIDKADETFLLGRVGRWWVPSDAAPTQYAFTVDQTGTVRVAIAWDSHPDGNHPPLADPQAADLDLYIYDAQNNLVTYSLSYDNTYEIVEFHAPGPGTYRAEIYPYRFDDTYEWLGLGWTVT